MNALLDPAAAAEAGRPHGQLASGLAGGGLVLTCQKIVDDGARTLILLAPGLFRMDVRPVEDTLQVMTRSLNEAPSRWATEENDAADYGKHSAEAEVPYRVRWRCIVDSKPHPMVAAVLLLTTLDRDGARRHFSAHAVVREMQGATVRWRD